MAEKWDQCEAADLHDKRECVGSQVAVRIVDQHNQEKNACVLHGGVLLANTVRGKVRAGSETGAGIAVYQLAKELTHGPHYAGLLLDQARDRAVVLRAQYHPTPQPQGWTECGNCGRDMIVGLAYCDTCTAAAEAEYDPTHLCGTCGTLHSGSPETCRTCEVCRGDLESDLKTRLTQEISRAQSKAMLVEERMVHDAIAKVLSNEVAGLRRLSWKVNRFVSDQHSEMLVGQAGDYTDSRAEAICVVHEYACALGDGEVTVDDSSGLIVIAEARVRIKGIKARVWALLWLSEDDGSSGPKPSREEAAAIVAHAIEHGPVTKAGQ